MIYNWKKIVRISVPLLTLCAIIEISAGQILNLNQDKLIFFPIFLISIPVINSIAGNIGSILGARLASGLHVGYITININDKNMIENLLTAILLGFIVYLLLAILIYFTAILGGIKMGISLLEFTSIILGAGFLLVCIISILSVLTAFVSFKRGLDPDDMIAPIVTTFGDSVGILLLFLFIGVIGI